MLNTGTSLISDVLGKDTKSAAFVYGIYSLFDKFANGIAGYLLVAYFSKDVLALKLILGLITTFSAIGCAIITFIGVRIYKDKLAKISTGSVMKTVGVNPKADIIYEMDTEENEKNTHTNTVVDASQIDDDGDQNQQLLDDNA